MSSSSEKPKPGTDPARPTNGSTPAPSPTPASKPTASDKWDDRRSDLLAEWGAATLNARVLGLADPPPPRGLELLDQVEQS